VRTKTRFVKITSLKGFKRLGLRKTKTAIYRELTAHISKLGTKYSSIRVMLGPRDGLRGYIAESQQEVELRIAEYTMKSLITMEQNRWLMVSQYGELNNSMNCYF